jgi:hypothetical protein
LQKEQKSQGLRSQISALLLEKSSFCFSICFVSKCVYYPVAFSRLLYRKGITCFIHDITFQKRICMFDSEITCLTKACICINENTHIFSSDIVERRSRRTNKKKHHVSTVRIKMCNALPKKDRFKNSILLIKRITQKLLQSRARQAAVMKRWLPCPFFASSVTEFKILHTVLFRPSTLPKHFADLADLDPLVKQH